MSRYAAVLVLPIIVGTLIAVAVLLINGLRERREQRHGVTRSKTPPGAPLRQLDGSRDASEPAAQDHDAGGQRRGALGEDHVERWART